MALNAGSDNELKRRSAERLQSTTDPVERLRLKCLARGANGIRGLGRSFRIFDNTGDRQLEFFEFSQGVDDYGLMLSKDEKTKAFAAFDRDGSGKIDFDEFLEKLRPPMSEKRKKLIGMAFNKMDKTGDGRITVEDLKGVYNVKKHPKYVNGEWTERQCKQTFVDTFDVRGNRDGIVTQDEFLNYYAAVSASIDQDGYFDLMMRNSFDLTTE